MPWTLPGGEIELGESAEAAAIRELEEETGYHVELDELLAVDIEHKEPAERWDESARHYRFVRIIFRARLTGGRLRAEAAGTTAWRAQPALSQGRNQLRAARRRSARRRFSSASRRTASSGVGAEPP